MQPPKNPIATTKKNKAKLNYRTPTLSIDEPKVTPIMDQKTYQMKLKKTPFNLTENIVSPMRSVGIDTNTRLIALPCQTINQRNNYRILGKPIEFDSSTINAKAQKWSSQLSFVPDRYGLSADFKQKPTFIYSTVR